MRAITVARKPLSESTVASNVLKHKTGALNIKNSRIGTEVVSTHSRGKNMAFPKRPGEDTVEESGRKVRQDLVDHSDRIGRWPANLILQHLDGCRCDGVKRVKASAAASGPSLTGKSMSNSRGVFNGVESTPFYGGDDGKETVANWICAEGCPVRALDNQSGILKSGAMDSIATGGQYTTYGKMYERRVMNPASEGGASRFFKQVKE